MASNNSINNRTNSLSINGAYSLPTVDGSNTYVLSTNGSGTVSWVSPSLIGFVLQSVENSTSSVINANVAIPFDNTKPQNTEGVEIITATITPHSVSNLLRITYLINGNAESGSSNLTLTTAFFQDSTSDAIFTAYAHSSASSPASLSGTFFFTAGTTSATTIKMRLGLENTTSFFVNGNAAGNPVFNGTSKCIISIQETKV